MINYAICPGVDEFCGEVFLVTFDTVTDVLCPPCRLENDKRWNEKFSSGNK